MSIEKERVRVFMAKDGPQSYIGLLAKSLSLCGVDVQQMPFRLSRDWLTKNHTDCGSILHLHWPQYSYSADERQVTEDLIDRWLENLHFATTMGYRIVWTAHTLYPHDAPHKDLQQKAREGLIRYCSAVIVHTNNALSEIKTTFHTSKVVLAVIPHGNYREYSSSYEARIRLSMPPNEHIYLFFGSIRLYKGLMNLLFEFDKANIDNSALLIAGRPFSAEIGRELMAATRQRKSVYCHPFYIPDHEVPIYFAAADVVVLPYSESSTSGVGVLAHSFGKPVIAPAIGGFPEMVPSGTGWLYDPAVENGLRSALREPLGMDKDLMSKRCVEFARTLDWSRIASATSDIYSRLL
jgi:beta-1,4-mannosyltransferase